MERQNVLGMICGYYRSRFDHDAYGRLGCKTQSATHILLAETLSVPSDSIRNWRDEFDPAHDNPRQGWHNREMYSSRKRVIEAFGNLTEPEVFAIVQSIMNAPAGQAASEIIQSLGGTDLETDVTSASFGLRGPTGAKAEEAFKAFHMQTNRPQEGVLRDCRHDQCGYDFAIESEFGIDVVEVKGLAGQLGGISFTDKEWRVAAEMGNRYHLVIVRNVGSAPEVSIIKNPTAIMQPKMRLYNTVQVSWSVGQASLLSAEAKP